MKRSGRILRISKGSLAALRSAGVEFWMWATKPDLWAGFYPTLVLGFLAYQAWLQTRQQIDQVNQQITMTREEMQYSRKPTILVGWQHGTKWDDPNTDKLVISNVGNDSAFNFTVHSSIYIVSKSKVYTYAPWDLGEPYSTDTTRNPREKMFPLAVLCPQQQLDIDWQWRTVLDFRYSYIIDSGDYPIWRDLNNMCVKLGGRPILMVTCAYRRNVDYAQTADSFFFSFRFPASWHGQLRDEVGGPRVITLIKEYLNAGPEVTVHIFRDHYQICTENIFTRPTGGAVQFMRRDTIWYQEPPPQMTIWGSP